MRKMSFERYGDEFYAKRIEDSCSEMSSGLYGEYSKYNIGNIYDPIYESYLNRTLDSRIKCGEYAKEFHFPRQSLTEKKNTKENVRQKKHINLFALLVTFGVLISMCFISAIYFRTLASYTTYTRHMNNGKNFSEVNAMQNEMDEDKKYASMVILESNSGRILEEYKADERLPMASTTKIATAILVLEKIQDLDQKFDIPKEAVGVVGSSIYLRDNEKLSVRDLLYGLILASGNDSATALAIICSGDEKTFVKEMNDLAARLQLSGTHFVTAHGLHDDDHYTTAKDLAKLTAYAMKNEEFREIVNTKRRTIENINQKEPRYLKNKQVLMFDEEIEEKNIIINGVKSGYTPEAGRCLVTSAKLNGMDIIIVVLNSPDMFKTTEELIYSIKEKYNMDNIIPPYNHISKIGVDKGNIESINICTKQGFSYPTTRLEHTQLKTTSDYPERIQAPIKSDTEIGQVKVFIAEEEIFCTPILTIESVESTDYVHFFKRIIKDAR